MLEKAFDALDSGLLIVWILVSAGCIFIKKNFRPLSNPFLDAELQVNYDDIYLNEAPIELTNADATGAEEIKEANSRLVEIVKHTPHFDFDVASQVTNQISSRVSNRTDMQVDEQDSNQAHRQDAIVLTPAKSLEESLEEIDRLIQELKGSQLC